MIYRIVGTALLIALAVAGLILLSSEQGTLAPAPARREQAPDPGYSARGASLIETGPDGRPLYALQAAAIREQPNGERATLDEVALTFHDPNGQVWTGTSDHALIEGNDAARIEMLGNVRITGLLPGTQVPAHIATDQLQVDTHAQVVSSPARVTLDWGSQHLASRGITAHLRSSRVRLESDVHGTLQP